MYNLESVGKSSTTRPLSNGGPKQGQLYFVEHRKAKKLTGQKVADRMGTTKGTVSKLENGDIEATAAYQASYAAACGITPEELWSPPGGDTIILRGVPAELRQNLQGIVAAFMRGSVS